MRTFYVVILSFHLKRFVWCRFLRQSFDLRQKMTMSALSSPPPTMNQTTHPTHHPTHQTEEHHQHPQHQQSHHHPHQPLDLQSQYYQPPHQRFGSFNSSFSSFNPSFNSFNSMTSFNSFAAGTQNWGPEPKVADSLVNELQVFN